jgi:hypothetical protein
MSWPEKVHTRIIRYDALVREREQSTLTETRRELEQDAGDHDDKGVSAEQMVVDIGKDAGGEHSSSEQREYSEAAKNIRAMGHLRVDLRGNGDAKAEEESVNNV